MVKRDFAEVVLSSSANAFFNRLGSKQEQRDFAHEVTAHTLPEFRYSLEGSYTLDRDLPAEEFDRISYHLFNEGLKRVIDPHARNQIASEIGHAIYRQYVQARPRKYGSESADEIARVEADFRHLVRYFVLVGFLSGGEIYFGPFDKGSMSWNGFDREKWDTEGVGEFYYEMNNPIILLSAQELYKKYGFAQHYSSRAMEALLLAHGIDGREDEDFDPTLFSSDSVIEHWNMRRIG